MRIIRKRSEGLGERLNGFIRTRGKGEKKNFWVGKNKEKKSRVGDASFQIRWENGLIPVIGHRSSKND
jgi:hypothetical protein